MNRPKLLLDENLSPQIAVRLRAEGVDVVHVRARGLLEASDAAVRDRLLKIPEVAEHLGVSNATVYGLCERGELPYVWVVTAMRIRPRDLEEFVASRRTLPEERRPHRRKQSSE